MRYIHSLCLHISRTVLRLLGLLLNAGESKNKCINRHKTILRRDCTLEVLGAAPAYARDEDDVIEEVAKDLSIKKIKRPGSPSIDLTKKKRHKTERKYYLLLLLFFFFLKI